MTVWGNIDEWYYFNPQSDGIREKGYMKTGWQLIGYWFYFNRPEMIKGLQE